MEARLNANMAWALLQMTGEPDHVKRASEFASESLKVYDRNDQSSEPFTIGGWSRTLGLVAESSLQSKFV